MTTLPVDALNYRVAPRGSYPLTTDFDPLTGTLPGIDAGGTPRPWGSGLFSTSDIAAWLAGRATDFHSGLINILRIKGVDTHSEMIFQFNGLGNIALVSDHADRNSIERVVNADKELRTAFFIIASTARFLDTLSARPDFEERYKLNPDQAMTEYVPLAASLTRPTFNLQVSRAGLTTYFTPQP